MSKKPLYTIGHGARKGEQFLELLKFYGITYLADIRSRPYSRFHKQFNREMLQETLAARGITYVFMGDELGGRPADPSCYDEQGKVSYALIRSRPFFLHGISRLETAYDKNLALAMMCSESDPAHCHRTHLVGNELDQRGIPLKHIDQKGLLKDHGTVLKDQGFREGNISIW